MLALALALIALSSVEGVQDQAYDLKLDSPRKAGQKLQILEVQHTKMSMLVNGQPAAASEEKIHVEALEEVVSADGPGVFELRWTFSKAETTSEGKAVPLGFQGKTVRATKAKDEETRYAYAEGGALADGDLAALKKVFDDKGDDSASKALAPGKPVKVGESWSPEIRALAEMLDKDMAGAVDVAKSSARFTLKAVEKRGGADFGKIEGHVELALGALGPLKLETPLVMKMSLELDVRVDGSRPDGVAKFKAVMKGASAAEADGNKVNLDVDLTSVGHATKTTAK
jgi:hypothetical protein